MHLTEADLQKYVKSSSAGFCEFQLFNESKVQQKWQMTNVIPLDTGETVLDAAPCDEVQLSWYALSAPLADTASAFRKENQSFCL